MHIPKILLIDEKQENQDFFRALFEKWSLEVNAVKDVSNSLIRMNIYKPEIVLLSTELNLNYIDTINFILNKNCKLILYGSDPKGQINAKWGKHPMVKGPLPLPLDITKFKNILYPLFQSGYIKSDPQSHIELVVNEKVGVIEVEGAITWEQVHEMKYRIMHLLKQEEIMGVVFIFHQIDNKDIEMEENIHHLLSFIQDEHFDPSFVKFLTIEDEVAGVLQMSKTYRKLERVSSYAEAYMKIQNVLSNKTSLGLDLDFVRENMRLVEDVYAEDGHLIKKAGETFNRHDLDLMRNKGINKIYYARELSQLGVGMDSLSNVKENIENLIMNQVESSRDKEEETQLHTISEKKMVVIIDDDTQSQSLIGKVLTRMGLEYKIATDGAEGLKYCITYNPNLILLDLMMPKMNGVEFIKKYREIRQKMAAPIVVLSGISRSDVIQTVLKLGVRDYILKPMDLKTISEKIVRNLS